MEVKGHDVRAHDRDTRDDGQAKRARVRSARERSPGIFRDTSQFSLNFLIKSCTLAFSFRLISVIKMTSLDPQNTLMLTLGQLL